MNRNCLYLYSFRREKKFGSVDVFFAWKKNKLKVLGKSLEGGVLMWRKEEAN